jgi:hypothetical protein
VSVNTTYCRCWWKNGQCEQSAENTQTEGRHRQKKKERSIVFFVIDFWYTLTSTRTVHVRVHRGYLRSAETGKNETILRYSRQGFLRNNAKL